MSMLPYVALESEELEDAIEDLEGTD